jgi:tmRNA-binding protein
MAFNKAKMLEMLERLRHDKEKYAEFISLYCLSRSIKTGNDWDRIMALTPVNSVLNLVIEQTRKGTDFPHQIAFFGVLHYLAGYLLTREIHIDLDGQKIYPDIWNIVLAPSGSGKSTVESFISKLFCDVDLKKLEPFTTAKAYVQNLAETPKGLLVKDEFAQLLAGMEQQTYLLELKEYFLKTYDNADISRTTGKDSIVAEEPAISIYGSTVDRTFTKYISEEMLLDGFAQRFNYVFCEERDKKKALLRHNQGIEAIRDELNKTIGTIEHLKFYLSDKAIKEFEKLFHQNYNQFKGISYSFFRRTQFKTLKYALLYHVLLNKSSNMIDEEDIRWADRITFTHFVDLKKMLDMYDENEAHSIIDRAIELKDKFKEQGKQFTPRDITKYLKGKVKNIAEAKLLHSLVMDIEKVKEQHDPNEVSALN